MIALIPARGGSKRLPRKALADLGGKPLLAWTLEAATAAGCFTDLIVTSDDAEIRAVAEARGAAAWTRPLELATDRATLRQVVRWAQTQLAGPLAVLLPTSPFRQPATLQRAVESFARRRVAELQSVSPYAHPPQWAVIRQGLFLEPAYRHLIDQPRGALTPAWHHDGHTWIVGGAGAGILAIETPPDEALDINTPDDLDRARWMLSRRPAPAAKT